MKYWMKEIIIFSPVFTEIFSIYVLEAIFNIALKSYSLEVEVQWSKDWVTMI